MDKKDLSNVEIALFALYRLGGVTKKVHTEYIAWEAFKLASERFSWRLPEFKERGWPDKTTVRYALEKSGGFVRGRAGGDAGGRESEGWVFTSKGAEWIKQNECRIANALNLGSTGTHSNIHPRDAERFLRKLKKDLSYLSFLTKGHLDDVSPYMFTDMLGCTPDAPREVISNKFDRFYSTALLIDDKRVIDFLENCKEKFNSLMV